MQRSGKLRVSIFVLLVASLAPTPAAATGETCIGSDWKVDEVRLPYGGTRTVSNYVELGDVIAVKSTKLAELRKCATPDLPVSLYLNKMPLQGLAEFPPSNPEGDEAWFTLKVDASNRVVWNTLLGSPGISGTRPVAVSVGLWGGYPINTSQNISLRPLPPFWFGLWTVLFLVGLVAFFWFAAKSNLLRGGAPAGGQIFSIGRSQAAWWFFLMIAAYLFIGLTTGDYTTSLNQTALVLLGIASATHLGSAAVDASKKTPKEADDQQAAREKLQTHIDNLANATTADDKAAKSGHEAKLATLNGISQGWLKDVLSDADGIDFHRFQMLAWTFVLGIIFVVQVWHGLAMPDFSDTLLSLMGLSAATYVGLKIPEATK